MKWYLALLVSLMIFLGGPGSLAVASGDADSGVGGDDAAGLYASYCAGCHGAQGQGGYGPALTGFEKRSDAQLFEIITQGVGGMPGFGEKLSQAEIETLVSFIQKLPGGLSEEGETEEAMPAVTLAVPARLSLDLTPQGDGVITARVGLQSEGGKPISDAPITLYRQTVLGGKLPLAEATTDARGEAVLQFAAVRGQTVALEAAYAGSDNWGPAKVQGQVAVPGTVTLPPVISGLTSPTPPPAFATILIAVVGAVWVTYGYIVYQLACIATQREK